MLPEFIQAELASGPTQTVRDVVHRRLLQPELHQGFVATLTRALFNSYSPLNLTPAKKKKKRKKPLYLLDEVAHLHVTPLLRHVRLHLGVRVIDDGQEHVLWWRADGDDASAESIWRMLAWVAQVRALTMRMKKMKKTKVVK